MYTITKKKGSANIIWDPKAEKPLCKFTQGFFSTSDKDIADRLAKLGHKVEGLAEKAEAKQEMAKGEGVDKESETYKMALDIVRSAYPEASDRIAEGQANVIYSMFTRAEERGILKILGYKDATEAMDDMIVARKEMYDAQRITEERAAAQTLKQSENYDRENPGDFFRSKEYEEMSGEEKLKYDMDAWGKSVDNYLTAPDQVDQSIRVMQTPLVFEFVDKSYVDVTAGFPIKIAPSIMNKVLIKTEAERGHANKISPEIFKRLPELLADPVLIMKNRDNKGNIIADELLTIVEARDNVGAIINVPIVFKKDGGHYKIKSFFGRNSDLTLERRMLYGDVFYINKEKTTAWTASAGQQSPMALSISGSFKDIPNERNLVKLKNDNKALYQEKLSGEEIPNPVNPEKIQGAYIPPEQGKAIIELYKNADYSTLSHEMMHHFVNLYKQAIETGQASQEVIRDFGILNKFVGSKEGEAWTAAQHEKITSAYETYLSEGKAPSLELVGVFEKFTNWMKNIYKKMTRQAIPINDDVRGVFDRMLASEEQINAAELFYNSERFFGGKELGLKELKEYTKLLEDSHKEALAIMQSRIMKERTPDFKQREQEATAKITAEAEASMHQDPYFAARLLIEAKAKGGTVADDVLGADFVKDNGGGLKINLKQAIEQYGEQAVSEMPQSWFSKDGKWSLDDVADIVGLKSGDELRQSILNSKGYKAELNRRVTEQLAKWRDQELGNIQDMAIQLVNSDKSLEAIGIEAEVLKNALNELQQKKRKETAEAMAEGREKAAIERRAARDTRRQDAEVMQGKLKAKVVREIARQTIGNQRISEAGNWRKMLAASTKASKMATRAMGRGDYNEAVKLKDEELLQRAMAMEAMKAEKEIQVGMRFFRRINKRGLDEKGIDHRFNVQIDQLMQKYGLLKREPLQPLDGSAPVSLQEFIDSCSENYFVPIVPESIVKGDPVHYSRLSLNEFRDLKDGTKSLQHVGKIMDRALSDTEQTSMLERVQAVVDNVLGHKEKYNNASEMGQETPTLRDRLQRLVDIPIASMVKTETLLRIIDKGEEQGPAVRYILNPILRGLDDVSRRNAKAIEDITKVLSDTGWDRKSIEAMKDQKHHFDFLPNDLTMEEIVLAAMNWGNEGNRDRLRYYFKTPDQRRMKMSEMENQQIDMLVQQVFSVMEEKHWKLVQGVWDYLNTYAPEIRQHEIDCAGIDVKMVEATPFSVMTKDGVTMDLTGGYYPIAYDPGKSIVAMNQQEANALFKTNPTAGAMTSHGHTNSRVNSVSRPLLLSWSAFTNHIQNVNYDLAMRKPVIDVNKIIKNPDFISALDSRFGVSTTKTLQDWLINIAADQRERLTTVERVVRELRTRMSVAMLGFRAKALVIDLPQNVITAIWQQGAGNVIKGLQEFYLGNPMEKMDYVNARSAMMREKTSFMDQNMSDFRNHMFEYETVMGIDKTKLAKTAFICDMVADMAVNYPMWLHQYSKAIAEGKSEAEACTIADSMIRRSSVDTSKAGLSAIQRGGEGSKLLLPFYSFFNAMFNRIWFDAKLGQIRMEDGRPMDAAKLFARTAFLGLVAPMMVEGIMNYELSNDRSKDKKKADEKAMKQGAVSALSFPFQMIPILGGGISYGLNKMAGTYGSYELSPIESTIEKTFGTPAAWYKFLVNKGGDPEAGRKALTQTADTASLLMGYPMKINTLAINIWDAISKGDIAFADLISRRSGNK